MSIILKLISGETIITELDKETSEVSIICKNPMGIVMNSEAQMMLLPFPIGSKKSENCVISLHHILSSSTPSMELGLFYANQQINDKSNCSVQSFLIH
jgi:hypothetical protein